VTIADALIIAASMWRESWSRQMWLSHG